MTPERLHCLVPGCHHTTSAARKNGEVWTSWICGDHWMALPKRRRQVWYRVHRRHRQGKAVGLDIQNRLWNHLVKMATERAVGIG